MPKPASISVSAATFARLAAYCDATDRTLRGVVEQAVRPVLNGNTPPGLLERVRASLGRSFRGNQFAPASYLEQTTTRARVAIRYAKLVGCSLRDAGQIFRINDRHYLREVWDRLYPGEDPVRHVSPWMPARVPVVQQFPPGATCAICIGPAVGALHREPLGRDGGLVNVCVSCATQAPRLAAGATR